MNLAELMRSIVNTRPAAIPDLLEANVEALIDGMERVEDDFAAASSRWPEARDSLFVADNWFQLLVVTDGAFWDEVADRPKLTRFGARVLHDAALAIHALQMQGELPDSSVDLPGDAEDLHRVLRMLWRYLSGEVGGTAGVPAPVLQLLGVVAVVVADMARHYGMASEVAAMVMGQLAELLSGAPPSFLHPERQFNQRLVERLRSAVQQNAASGSGQQAVVIAQEAFEALQRYSVEHAPSDLDAALQGFVEAAEQQDAFPPGSGQRYFLLLNWGAALLLDFERRQDLAALDRGLVCYEEAASNEQDPDLEPSLRVALRWSWAHMLAVRYQTTHDLSDLDAALTQYNAAMKLEAELRPATTIAHDVERLHRALWARAQDPSTDMVTALWLADIGERVIALVRYGTPEERHMVATALSEVATSFYYLSHYQLPGEEAARLSHGIRLYEAIEAYFRPSSEELARSRMNHGNAHLARFRVSGNPSELDETLILYEQAIADFPPATDEAAGCWTNWGNALLTRYEAFHAVTDLDAAIERYEAAVFGPDSSAIHVAMRDMNLAIALIDRFKLSGDAIDLNRAIDSFTAAEWSLPADTPNGATCRMNHAGALQLRAESTVKLETFDAALRLHAEADASLRPGTAAWAENRVNWAVTQTHRFDISSDPRDLDDAIKRLVGAEVDLPADAPGQLNRALNAGVAYAQRYAALGDLDDLEQAIAAFAAMLTAVDAAEQAYFRALCQVNYAKALSDRYRATGDEADLAAACELYEAAEQAFPPDSLEGATLRMNYAIALQEWFVTASDPAVLDAAIARYREAVALLPDGTFLQGLALLNWGAALWDRLIMHEQPTDLTEATQKWERAAAILPSESQPGAILRLNLASAYLEQWRRFHDGAALARGRALAEEAIAVLRRVGSPLALYDALKVRARAEQRADDQTAAYATLAEAIELHEQRLLGLPDEASLVHRLGEEGSVYQAMVTTCLALAQAAADVAERAHYERAAWEYANRGKARMVVQVLDQLTKGEEAVAVAPAVHARQQELLDLLRALREKRQALARLMRTTEATATGISLPVTPQGAGVVSAIGTVALAASLHSNQHRQALELERQEREIRRWLAEVSPELGRLQDVHRPDLSAVQEALQRVPDGAVLVEFFTALEKLAVFVLDGERLQITTLPVALPQLRTQTTMLRAYASEAPVGEFATIADATLAQLAEHLWPLLHPYLPERDAANERVPHVLLAPAGLLHFWPLHALPISGSDGRERLIDHVACTVVPASDALPALAKQMVQPGPHRVFAPSTDLRFAPPQAHYEAAALAGEAFVGSRASMKSLRQSVGGSLSFATHAAADLDQPEHSILQLMGPSGAEPVSALEFIAGLAPKGCELVALWACETHGSGVGGGDSWGGLTRAFLQAGRTLLASLWPIGDAATLALDVPFCDGLLAGLTIPQALRKAMLALRNAGWAEVVGWAERIAAVLPKEDQRPFLDAWYEVMAVPSRDAWMDPQAQPHFNELRYWAPYLAIGWPGPLQM